MTIAEIKRNIAERLGISELNALQQAAVASNARRLLMLAPTGSGKTLAFALVMLSRIPAGGRGRVEGVVIAPSRELVLQIYQILRKVSDGLRVVALYGGHSFADETASLSAVTPDIVVATPGRLLDHMQRGTLSVSRPSVLVLDEYDKALELGFAAEMRRIARRIGAPGSIVLTSATRLDAMPDFVDLRGLETIDCVSDGKKAAAPALNIARIDSPARDKAQTLIDLLKSLPDGKALVFVNHRESAERVHDILVRAGIPAGLYHGALEQFERETALELFANGTTPVLVTTDLASRGLDIEAVGAVIHYHMPVSAEAWTHRNGRTARAGAAGDVYVICSEADNVADYMVFDRNYNPTGRSASPIRAHYETLRFSSGKKEKISRGDIVGFLCQKGGLTGDEIGRIMLADHWALVAVPAARGLELAERLAQERIKGKRVRISLVK